MNCDACYSNITDRNWLPTTFRLNIYQKTPNTSNNKDKKPYLLRGLCILWKTTFATLMDADWLWLYITLK